MSILINMYYKNIHNAKSSCGSPPPLHFDIWAATLPPGVKNVKVQENSEQIWGHQAGGPNAGTRQARGLIAAARQARRPSA